MTGVVPDPGTSVVASMAVGGVVEDGGVVADGGAAEGAAEGGATALFSMLAEQMTRAPPPLAEPLHWLTLTLRAAASVPVAVQVRPTRVPPLAEPLH